MPITGTGVHMKGYIAGGPRLAGELAKLRKSLSDAALVQATSAGAEVLSSEWKAQARSRLNVGPPTAHFPDAIGWEASPGNQGATAVVGLLKDVPLAEGEDHPRRYGPTLEFGRANHPAQPTLRPSVDSAKYRVIDAMATVLRKVLT